MLRRKVVVTAQSDVSSLVYLALCGVVVTTLDESSCVRKSRRVGLMFLQQYVVRERSVGCQRQGSSVNAVCTCIALGVQ